jgi:hypothetical protein
MTSTDATALGAATEPEVQAALIAIRRAVASPEGAVTPATETQIQNSLYRLRAASPYCEAVAALEKAAADVRLIAEAKHAGLCNLYRSKLLRLRKQLCA